MNISPTLPNPRDLPAQQGKKAVAAVQPTRPSRDTTDQEQPRRPLPGPERLEQAASATRIASLYQEAVVAGAGHASRAVAAYAAVADDVDRSELRRMLGFDAYA